MARLVQDRVSATALVDCILWLFRLLHVEIFLVCFLIYEFHRRIYVFFKCFRRDLSYIKKMKQVLKVAKKMEADDETVYSAFHKLAVSRPNDVCFYYEDKTWTYRDVEDFADRIAQIASADGFKKGDTIALVMGNRPEYLGVRVGLAQLGVITALVNTNLRGCSLENTIEMVSSKGIIVESEFTEAIHGIRSAGRLPGVVKVYQFEGDLVPGSDDLKARMAAAPPGRPEVPDPPHFHDTAMYVYSSGTTGLPKACILPHSKIILGPVVFQTIMNVTRQREDLLYTCMPLYHLAAGGYGVGMALVCGVPVAIARKFSASRFWSDCIKFNATMAQYIGEMCRFLMSQPQQPNNEREQHKIRFMVGNGIRPALWKPFQQRFNIPLIVEVYGSTEGNSNLPENYVGAVGFVPRILPLSFWPVALVRVNPDTEEFIRGPDGLCQRCDIDEPGILIGRISNDIGRTFYGYTDREATNQKIARDVFAKGDQWFNSGDLLLMDELGYLFFKDRCGDTYRWKGENVATAEIESIMKSILPDKDFSVYGVQVPGTEGRCGMAAIEDFNGNGNVDQSTLDTLLEGLKRSVPSYARPLFLRVMKEIPVNSTFKVKKRLLRKEAYDVTKIRDPLYFLDSKSGRYVPLTQSLFNDLNDGRVGI